MHLYIYRAFKKKLLPYKQKFSKIILILFLIESLGYASLLSICSLTKVMYQSIVYFRAIAFYDESAK